MKVTIAGEFDQKYSPYLTKGVEYEARVADWLGSRAGLFTITDDEGRQTSIIVHHFEQCAHLPDGAFWRFV